MLKCMCLGRNIIKGAPYLLPRLSIPVEFLVDDDDDFPLLDLLLSSILFELTGRLGDLGDKASGALCFFQALLTLSRNLSLKESAEHCDSDEKRTFNSSFCE